MRLKNYFESGLNIFSGFIISIIIFVSFSDKLISWNNFLIIFNYSFGFYFLNLEISIDGLAHLTKVNPNE